MASFTTATPGQINFITSLLNERGLSLDTACVRIFSHDDVEIERGYGGTASQLIDALKAMPRPERERTVPAAGLEAGMYKVGQDIFRVKISGAGRPYANVLVHDTILNGNYRDAAVWFDYAPGAVRKITPEHRMTVEQCAEFGLLYGTCCVCARTLTNPKSIAKGIGPICEKKV